MRKWIYDNPWIWVALFLTLIVAGSLVVVAIAELNKPEIVKEKRVTLGPQSQDFLQLGTRVA